MGESDEVTVNPKKNGSKPKTLCEEHKNFLVLLLEQNPQCQQLIVHFMACVTRTIKYIILHTLLTLS